MKSDSTEKRESDTKLRILLPSFPSPDHPSKQANNHDGDQLVLFDANYNPHSYLVEVKGGG